LHCCCPLAGLTLWLLSLQYCFGYMGQQLALRMRSMLFGSMLRQEIGWFDMEKNSSGQLGTLLGRWVPEACCGNA
jgi:hypothetical protein